MICQKQVENLECFNYLGCFITDDARCTRQIKSKIAMTKAAFNKKNVLFTSKLDLNLRKKHVNRYTWSIALCGAETWTLRKVDQKCLESFGMWRWRRIEKTSRTDRVRNEEVLHRAREDRNILHTIKRIKANRIGHILRKNCLLKMLLKVRLEGRIDVTGRPGRCKLLLNDLTETRRYWKLKEEALDRTLWRTGFGRVCVPVVRQYRTNE
jgi:hypothetical protein